MAAKGWWKAAWTPGIRRRRILLFSAVILILVVAAAAATVVVVVDNRRRLPGVALMAKTDQHQIQRLIEEWRVQGRKQSRRWQPSLLPHRISGSGGGSGGSRDFRSKKRQLIGSWPPTCRAKCGGCAPCQAVHVPIQPGRSNPLEYYPEAWRCKCRNRLFLP